MGYGPYSGVIMILLLCVMVGFALNFFATSDRRERRLNAGMVITCALALAVWLTRSHISLILLLVFGASVLATWMAFSLVVWSRLHRKLRRISFTSPPKMETPHTTETPLDVTRIVKILQQRFSANKVCWHVYLDDTMGRSSLCLDEAEEAKSVWVAFLALPAVHVFERASLVVAYNFAKIEQAVVSANFGGFVSAEKPFCGYRSVTLRPLREDALDLALPAYRRWLHAHQPEAQSPQPSCLLTVTLPAGRQQRVHARLSELFPGISLYQEQADLSSYCWTFGLDTWFDEGQLMLLGLCEHVILIPGTAGREGREKRTDLGGARSSPEPAARWNIPAVSGLLSVRPPRRDYHCIPFLGALLSIGIALLVWRIIRQVKTCGRQGYVDGAGSERAG